MLLEVIHVRIDVRRFAIQEFLDRRVKGAVLEPVVRPGGARVEAAAQLMLPLSSGLEALPSLCDGIVDSLVIAGLEMQAVKVRNTAPVASIQRGGALKEDGRRARGPLLRREKATQ